MSEQPERNLGLDLARATEAAALAAARWVGRGQKNEGDGAAVNALRLLLGTVRMDGIVVIGEGEKDEAPLLYNGEKLGREQAARFAKAAMTLERQLAALDDAVADELLALALEIARKVVLDIHDVRPEVVVDVVRAALAQLPLHHAVIQVHPEDAKLLRQYAGEQLAHAGHRVQENAALSRGDAILEAAGSHVDAALASRWRRVIDSLGRTHPWIGDDPPAAEPEPSAPPTAEPPAAAGADDAGGMAPT